MLKIQVQTSAEQNAAITEAVSQARANQDKLQEQLKGTLDLQAHKLIDAQREIEMYQEQLHFHQETLQVSCLVLYKENLPQFLVSV